MAKRYFIKEVESCIQCPHFWDESESCHHPHWERVTHVVTQYNTIPDDCPLPAKMGCYRKEDTTRITIIDKLD